MVSARPVHEGSNSAAFESGADVPSRARNGGLYTGERFAGPWGNVAIVPDSGAVADRREFLAWHHTVSSERAGNNRPQNANVPSRSFNAYGVVAPDSVEEGSLRRARVPPRG